ncbi:MAG: hypothetical protein GY928_02040 [Colwellia sp.]|nr:hypothetical protein [Colwellia sp.]
MYAGKTSLICDKPLKIKMRKIIEFTEDKIDEIMYDIRKSIHGLYQQNLNQSGIRIQIPDYFCDYIMRASEKHSHNFIFDEHKIKNLYGIQVLPAYDNFIIVYNIDMPLYENTAYQVINLK